MLKEQTLFFSGDGGYHTYRIPALLPTRDGGLLAFCEGRRGGEGDAGAIDIVSRRSDDGGETWGELKVVVNGGGNTAGNPAPVLDPQTGIIHLLYCFNLADRDEGQIHRGLGPRNVRVTVSCDQGRTWSLPRDITGQVKPAGWAWYATGPCHGICLQSGRLLIPCDTSLVMEDLSQMEGMFYSHAVYSDDHGQTWHTSNIVGPGCNESTAAQREDGAVLLNMRNYNDGCRAVAISYDGGRTFRGTRIDPALPDPVCQGSLLNVPGTGLFFSNCASFVRGDRTHMTVRLSRDGGQTWAASSTVYEGPSAYSDLAAVGENLFLLYEKGNTHPYERIELARLPVEWAEGTPLP